MIFSNISNMESTGPRSGKYSIFYRLIMNEFPGENCHQMISSSIHQILIDGEKIKLQIWKFPSEEVYI